MQSTDLCTGLLANHIEHEFVTIDEYIEGSRMDRDGSWGTTAEAITILYHITQISCSINCITQESLSLKHMEKITLCLPCILCLLMVITLM